MDQRGAEEAEVVDLVGVGEEVVGWVVHLREVEVAGR